MPSPTTAKIVAQAYGYHTEADGQIIHLYHSPTPDKIIHVATIGANGEILPWPGYTPADHECAMAIRATLPVR